METFSALLALCAGNSPVPVNSPHKGQWRGALMFSLICAWINDWVNNREAGDWRCHRGHYDVNVINKTVLLSWYGPAVSLVAGVLFLSCDVKNTKFNLFLYHYITWMDCSQHVSIMELVFSQLWFNNKSVLLTWYGPVVSPVAAVLFLSHDVKNTKFNQYLPVILTSLNGSNSRFWKLV